MKILISCYLGEIEGWMCLFEEFDFILKIED